MAIKRIMVLLIATVCFFSSAALSEASPQGGPVLVKGDGYVIWIQSLELNTTDDGSMSLSVNVWVHNTTEYELEIGIEEVTINGAEFISDGLRNCGTGDYPWNFWVWSEDGYTAIQREALYNPRTFSALLEIYEGYNWELLSTQRVMIDLAHLSY